MGTLLAEPLYMGVDTKRFLREVPAFFQSFEDALAELVQNAYRAEATKIEITLDLDARTLEVKDDGRGCGDPRALVTAGMTGWDEDVVVDPAGLGLFALLGLSSEVVIETRGYRNDGYRMTLTPECFTGRPVDLVELPWEEGPELHGLHIRAKIGEKANVKVDMNYRREYRTFRHFFPIHVTFTQINDGKAHTREMPPVTPNTAYIDTPVGRFQWAPNADPSRTYGCGLVAVWEHRTLPIAKGEHLWNEIEKLLGGRYVTEIIRHQDLLWYVDDKCGVRPKLPDRRELIQDENYLAAMRTLARSIMDAFDVPGIAAQVHEMEIEAELPKTEFAYDHACQVMRRNLQIHPFFRQARFTMDMALLIGGYHKSEWEIFGQYELDWHETDSCSVKLEQESGFFRYPLFAATEALAEALCRQKLYAVWNQGRAEKIEIRIEGGLVTDTPSGIMGVCEGIKVYNDGKLVGSLERFCPTDHAKFLVGETEYTDAAYIIVGTREDLLEEVKEREWRDDGVWMSWALSSLYNTDGLYNYLDGDYDDYTLDRDLLRTDTIRDLLAAFYPEMKEAAERFAALESWATDWNRKYGNLTWDMRRVNELAEKYPEVTELAELSRILAQLSRWHMNTAKYEPKVLQQGVTS